MVSILTVVIVGLLEITLCILEVSGGQRLLIFVNFQIFNRILFLLTVFYSEVWLFERNHQQFSAFDTIADLYFVRIPRSIYAERTPSFIDKLRFSFMYNFRKIQKHIFHYNYKQRCQQRFQQLKKQI